MSLYSKIIDQQKLGQAWDHVRKNHPASGIDNVTWEAFEENRKAELYQLYQELLEHNYEGLPVKQAKLFKGEKVRTIALFSMRDKVIQQSLANELGKIYEPMFSSCSYAYRPGQSALVALEKIEVKVTKGDLWVLKLDIADFFDNINHEKMLGKLRQQVHEDDVIDLAKEILRTRVLDEMSGELKDNFKGVFQGATCAPIFSNIYLMDFDKEMESEAEFYVRYSDDILCLESNEEKARALYERAKLLLEREGLELKDSKTLLHRLTAENGFEYLGYAFTTQGKVIPEKAVENLTERLEITWLTSGLNLEEKLLKCQEILGGWEQYFREERKPASMLEFVTLLSVIRKRKPEMVEALMEQRSTHQNYYKDVLGYMLEYWKESDDWQGAIAELEDYYQVVEEDVPLNNEKLGRELLQAYEQLLILPSEENFAEVIQAYTDLGCYQKASFFWEKKAELAREEKPIRPVATAVDGALEDSFLLAPSEIETYYKLFVGREDTYTKETIQDGNKRKCEQVMEPLTEEVLPRHFSGEDILGTYVQRNNLTVHYLVFDVDISKKILMQHPYGSEGFAAYKQKAAQYAGKLMKVLHDLGVRGYLEDSGFRGYHVWIFFTEWIPVRFVKPFAECIQSRLPDECVKDTEINLEVFPNGQRIRQGKYGQSIKLPLGVHIRSGERSFFLDDDGNAVNDYKEFFAGLAKLALPAIRKILGTYMPEVDVAPQKKGSPNGKPAATEHKQIEIDWDGLGVVSPSLRIVIENCSLMRYLIHKVMATGYLTHFERQTLLYVFGHMGDEGKDFVHTLMAFTLNYQYHVTQRFIQKMPDKPVGCIKLREQYRMITAEYGCSCSFRQTKNCYPSPVLHALKSSDEAEAEITVPTSRTLSKAKSEQVYEEINIHKQTQKLAQQIVEIKRQRNGLDKSIRKLEQELQRIFDNAGIDCLEIELGLLVRRKRENGYEWVIEI